MDKEINLSFIQCLGWYFLYKNRYFSKKSKKKDSIRRQTDGIPDYISS